MKKNSADVSFNSNNCVGSIQGLLVSHGFLVVIYIFYLPLAWSEKFIARQFFCFLTKDLLLYEVPACILCLFAFISFRSHVSYCCFSC